MSSNNIEENVVKMRFDNSEFDKNVEQSNETLDKFKDTIESLPNSINNGFQKAFSLVSLGDIINFAEIKRGFSDLEDHATDSITGIIPALKEVALEANNLFQQLTQINIIDQINSGGKQRALNIEDAMFRLKGLNLDADTFMRSANYAVKGTAYGLDAAAKVASQLGASGMTVEEDLNQALRAISGVAAMTNSSYEEIGRIFTFAASYGKVTSRQLLMLSVRGINATATMAKQMGKTEAEIRSMMSKGQITFKDFASAMDNAFGEHAKKANETFTGSMRNVRAALSRIGADAWTPFLNQMTLVYNRLQEMFDLAKKAIVSSHFYENWTKMLETISPIIQNYISWTGDALVKSRLVDEVVNMISQSFEFFTKIFTDFLKVNYSGWFLKTFNTIANVVKNVDFVLHNLVSTFEEIFGDYVKNGFTFVLELLFKLSDVVQYTEDDINSVKEVFKSWWEVLEQVLLAFEDIFGKITSAQIADTIKDLNKNLLEFVKGLKTGTTVTDRFRRVFKGAFSVLDIAKELFKSIYKFIKPIFSYIGPVADKVLTIAAKLGDILVNLRDTIKENSSIEIFFDKVTNFVVRLKNLIMGIGTSFFDAFFGEMGEETSFTDKVFAFIDKIGTVVSESFSDLKIGNIDLTPIKDFITKLYNFGFGKDEAAEAEKKIEGSMTLVDGIIWIYGKIKELIYGSGVKEVAEGNESGILDAVYDKLIEFMDWCKLLAEEVAKNSNMKDVGTGIAAVVASFALIITSIATLVEAFAELLATIALLVGSNRLINFKNEKLQMLKEQQANGDSGDGIFGLFGILDVVKTFTTSLIDIIKQFEAGGLLGLIAGNEKRGEAISKIIKSIMWLILAIAGSLYLVASIPVDNLNRAVGAFAAMVGIMLATLGIMVIVINVFNLKENISAVKAGNIVQLVRDPLKNMARAIVILGFALIEIAAALWIISKTGLNGKELMARAGILAAMLLGLTIIVAAMGAFLAICRQVNPLDMIASAGAVGIMGLALIAIAGAVAIVAHFTNGMTDGEVWRTAGLLEAMILGLAVILGLLTTFTASYDILATSFSMILMSIALGITLEAIANMIKVIANVKNIDSEKLDEIVQDIKAFAVIFGLLAGVLAFIGAIPGINFTEVGMVLIGTGILLMGIGSLLGPATLAIEAFTKFMFALFELFDVDSNGIENKVISILETLGKGLGKGVSNFFKELYVNNIDFLKEYIPKLFNFIAETLIPEFISFINKVTPEMVGNTINNMFAIIELLFTYAPDVIDKLIDFFYQVFFGFTDKSNGGLLETIFDWLDEFNKRLVDRIVENIPVWVDGAYRIIMAFITSLADTLEENQEEIETNVTRLFDIIIEIGKNILESEDTGITIREATGKMLGNILIGTADMFAGFGDAMRNLALHGLAEFLSGLSGQDASFFEDLLGLDSDSMNPVITPTLDLANVRKGTNEMKGLFNIGDIDTSGILQANDIPIRNIITGNSNRRAIEDLGEQMLNMNNSREDHIDVNVTLEPDKDRLFQIVNQQSTIYSRAGYSY